jgi:hypothetical protein
MPPVAAFKKHFGHETKCFIPKQFFDAPRSGIQKALWS